MGFEYISKNWFNFWYRNKRKKKFIEINGKLLVSGSDNVYVINVDEHKLDKTIENEDEDELKFEWPIEIEGYIITGNYHSLYQFNIQTGKIHLLKEKIYESGSINHITTIWNNKFITTCTRCNDINEWIIDN